MGESGTKSIVQWLLSIFLLIGVIATIVLAVVILVKVNDNKTTNVVNRKCRAIEGKIQICDSYQNSIP
jgi:hypothetical protein